MTGSGQATCIARAVGQPAQALRRTHTPQGPLLSQSRNEMKHLAACLLLAVAPMIACATTPFLYSRSAVVYDVGSGQVLLEKNPDDVAPLASLTKVMTAMVALDQDPLLDEALTVAGADIDLLKHSSSRIPVGTTLARREMLRLALMSSENRSASALSRAIAGGQPAFVEKMNEKANVLGMLHTHFVDPTGLSPHNVSTASDLVKMAGSAAHYRLIAEFTTLSRHRVDVGARRLVYRNTTPLVGQPGWDIQLAKTGFINEAGYCIVLEANIRNGPVIIALMGAATYRMRSADLISIRYWLEGKGMPGTSLRAEASKPIHPQRAAAALHKGGPRLASYARRSESKANRPPVRHPARGRRPSRATSGGHGS